MKTKKKILNKLPLKKCNKAFTFLFLILSISIYSCSSTRQEKNAKPFFFIQMADPQFGMFTNNKCFSRETKNFTKAIEDANFLKPRFVIVCGDLINQSNTPAQITEYKRIAAKLILQYNSTKLLVTMILETHLHTKV